MKVVYVAGPYLAPDRAGVEQNINIAHDFALELWRMGFAVICPQKNCAHFPNDESMYETWIQGDFEFVKRSDGVYMLPRWEESEGAKRERGYALKLGIPVFHTFKELKEWDVTSLCCKCGTFDEAKEKDCYHNPGCGLFRIREKSNPVDDPVLRAMASQGSSCPDCA